MSVSELLEYGREFLKIKIIRNFSIKSKIALRCISELRSEISEWIGYSW
jgi:hypothetical protein